MIVLEKIRIYVLSHDEAILPEVSGPLLQCTMLWAGLTHHLLKVEILPSKPRVWLSLTTLTIILCVGVSHKIQTTISLALTIAPPDSPGLCCCPLVLLLFFSLTRPFLIRLGVLGTIKVGMVDQSRHELPHVTAVVFEPPQLLLKRLKMAVFLQH